MRVRWSGIPTSHHRWEVRHRYSLRGWVRRRISRNASSPYPPRSRWDQSVLQEKTTKMSRPRIRISLQIYVSRYSSHAEQTSHRSPWDQRTGIWVRLRIRSRSSIWRILALANMERRAPRRVREASSGAVRYHVREILWYIWRAREYQMIQKTPSDSQAQGALYADGNNMRTLWSPWSIWWVWHFEGFWSWGSVYGWVAFCQKKIHYLY